MQSPSARVRASATADAAWIVAGVDAQLGAEPAGNAIPRDELEVLIAAVVAVVLHDQESGSVVATQRDVGHVQTVRVGDGIDCPISHLESTHIGIRVAAINGHVIAALAGDDEVTRATVVDREALDVGRQILGVDGSNLRAGGAAIRLSTVAPQRDIFLRDVKGAGSIVGNHSFGC